MDLKLLVLDIDGTLLKWKNSDYIWEFIFGKEKINYININLFENFQRNIITYKDWHLELFSTLKKSKINSDFFKKMITENLDINSPSVGIIEKVTSCFTYKAILSGSLEFSLDMSGIDKSIFDLILAHKIHFNNKGHIKAFEINEFGTGNGKVRGLEYLSNFFQVNYNEIMYVGDGLNDLEIINRLNELGGIGLALPPLALKPKLLINPQKRLESFGQISTYLDGKI